MEHRSVYNRQRWRELPRTRCFVSVLLGPTAGPCRGAIHRHHVDPEDPGSRTVEVCAAHHTRLHTVLRGLSSVRWRRCPHRHRTLEARQACERRLNQQAA